MSKLFTSHDTHLLLFRTVNPPSPEQSVALPPELWRAIAAELDDSILYEHRNLNSTFLDAAMNRRYETVKVVALKVSDQSAVVLYIEGPNRVNKGLKRLEYDLASIRRCVVLTSCLATLGSRAEFAIFIFGTTSN